MKPLPDYTPPPVLRASVAVGVAPLLVLLVFAMVVWRLMAADTAIATLAACCLWVMVEMRDYQRSIDAYNLAYVETHLQGLSNASLAALACNEHASPGTREFVREFLNDGRTLRPDRPRLR